jgi:hypothetical protein
MHSANFLLTLSNRIPYNSNEFQRIYADYRKFTE